MKRSAERVKIVAVLAVLAMGAALFASGANAQDQRWQVVRADYGYRDQRKDVTGLLQDLIAGGGVRGEIAVNNQTMGGDPAVGKDKNLRIFATDRDGNQREFDYREGSFIPAGMFEVRGNGRDDHDGRYRPDDQDNRGGYYGARERDDHDRLEILWAFYGVQGRTANVTDLVRGMVRDGRLRDEVTNGSMGGDPAIGADKMLIVVYRFHGREQATAVPEGRMLFLP